VASLPNLRALLISHSALTGKLHLDRHPRLERLAIKLSHPHAAVVAHVPDRREGGRHVAIRPARDQRAITAAERAALDEEAHRLERFVTDGSA
jgi:hypothetical protein